MVIDDIATVDFNYLITEPYEGQHNIELTYFQTWNPENESATHLVLDQDFTLHPITIITSYEIY